MGRSQGTSDPLPYTEVDRSVKAKAATLAGKLGVSNQHALGSLIEFWDMNGEPRALEALVTQGVTELVLTRADLVRRFSLASGKEIDPMVLVDLGLVEPRGDGASFRIRGMSRFFDPIAKRLKNRTSARKGGTTSAGVRKERYGSAQPSASGALEASASGSASGSAQALAQAFSNPSDQRSAISDQRSAISDQRSEEDDAQTIQPDLPGVPSTATMPPEPRGLSNWQKLHAEFEAARKARLEELGAYVPDEQLAPAMINAFFKRLVSVCHCEETYGELFALFDAYLEADWPAKYQPPYPLRVFASEKVWRKLLAKVQGEHTA